MKQQPTATPGTAPTSAKASGDPPGTESPPTNPNRTNTNQRYSPYFTFHEGRHTHSTWLVEDGIPEIARRARLGHKMQGIARIYEHLTPTMEQQTTNALEHRWNQSLQTLTTAEQDELSGWYPHVKQNIHDLQQAQVQAS